MPERRLPPTSDWEAHRDLVEDDLAAKRKQRRTRRYKYGTRKKLNRRVKSLNRFKSRELFAELGRRSYKARMAKLTPEERSAIQKRAVVTREIRRRFCDHTKYPPRFRKGGKHPGCWVCPSCLKVVPAPVKEEDLVL